MFHKVLIAATLAVGLISAQASAAFVSTDWKIAGDSLATLDTETGLEWLDLNQVTNKSYSTIMQNPDLYPSWRMASIIEVQELFERYMSYYVNRTPSNGFLSGESHSRTESVMFRTLFGQTFDGKYYRSNGFVYDEVLDRVSLFGFVTGSTQKENIFTFDYQPGSYTVNTANAYNGWFLVSDGGTTLSSINDPMLNINNPNAPINNPNAPIDTVDVSAPAGFAAAGTLMLMLGFRRKIKGVDYV